ncbi:hypothetical protein M9H77_28764 [Catharanthus roseus]|uniref:Uncharacterized protein n=1 Tax=Catharanthus roseus TaxID=4058 RepID=A0ACC0AKE4_CATRO|nr:hypothetical protein M9H77_28764 [Catharanthus roseus]
MGHSNIWNAHPKLYGPGSRACRVCGNSHGIIRKYGLMCCRQCFRSNAKEIGFIKEKEAKKEAFRKYLESSGVLDALTKVLVALYEQNDKPSAAIEFIQQKLGGPTLSDHEKLQAELSDLQIRYNELLATHQETCRSLEELKRSNVDVSSKEMVEGRASNEGL